MHRPRHSLSLSLSGQDMVGQEVMLCVHNILVATTFWSLIDQDILSLPLSLSLSGQDMVGLAIVRF